MAAKIHTSARALLVLLGAALIGGCGRKGPASASSVASAGELLIEWQPRPQPGDAVPEVQVEVRGMEGEAPTRRRVDLRAPDDLQARLSLPPGVYDVRLSPAVLRTASAGDEVAGATGGHSLRLPPPQIVLVRAASTTRASVALGNETRASVELGDDSAEPLASLQEAL